MTTGCSPTGTPRAARTYADGAAVAYAVRLWQGGGLELRGARREWHNLVEDTSSNNTWAWGDGPRPSLDDEQPSRYNARPDSWGFELGEPIAWTRPRRYEVGLGLEL